MLGNRGGQWILIALALTACELQPKRYSDQRETGRSATKGTAQSEARPIELLFDSSKLLAAPGPYDLEVSFAVGDQAPEVLKREQIQPNAKVSKIMLTHPPTSSGGLLTLSFSQGQTLKFVAKRAKTTFSAETPLRIADCLILPAPWKGEADDGSCAWSIEDVAN